MTDQTRPYADADLAALEAERAALLAEETVTTDPEKLEGLVSQLDAIGRAISDRSASGIQEVIIKLRWLADDLDRTVMMEPIHKRTVATSLAALERTEISYTPTASVAPSGIG